MSCARPPTPALPLLLACLTLLLSGCDQLGIEAASAVAARREAEGKAVGGACRHAGRAIEDCYGLNKKADKAAVFAGWREMNDYMRENKIDAVAPAPSSDQAGSAAAHGDDDKPAAMVGDKSGDKPREKLAERVAKK
jgi:hypothetical protein